jgi:hypothetical protein
MHAINYYLQIPRGYCQWLGGLRWSYTLDAVEYEDVGTFAFAADIARFLEGFASQRPLIHFGSVLHLLHLLGYGRIAPPIELVALRTAYRDAGRPARNAGVVCAQLCRSLPSAPGELNPKEVCRRLSGPREASMLYPSWVIAPFGAPAEEPAVSPGQLEELLAAALERVRPEELLHWFRHGTGAMRDAGEEVARETLASKPRTLEGVLATLVQNPRLAGAVPFVAQLVSALALPPRRLVQPELPIGGYADVATRGDAERILPSQFAMDKLEFVRRFAAYELLYFRREEPQSQTREELVLLLDQGVRTWGMVRLILSAAALALGKLAARRKLPFLLSGTSSGGRLLDPLIVDDGALSDLVEASDLSLDPGLALECLLERPSPNVRDVVLLTHPRSLAQEEVLSAARRVGKGTRLFCVAVDELGVVGFSEIRHGTPVKLGQYHIDLSARNQRAPLDRVEPRRRTQASAYTPWRGDVEPVPYPFWAGLAGRVVGGFFDFDYEGRWLLVVSELGMLHACKLDGTQAEVLPRGYVNDSVQLNPEVVLGVAGGFVVAGALAGEIVAVHYDLLSRRAKAYVIPRTRPSVWLWTYVRELHSVVMRIPGPAWVIDLASGSLCEGTTLESRAPSRACQAIKATADYAAAPPRLMLDWQRCVNGFSRPATEKTPRIRLDRQTGTITLEGVDPPWPPFTPIGDGKGVLKDCQVTAAVYSQGILAGCFVRDNLPRSVVLRVFRGPEGIPIHEYHQAYEFTLSPDGRLLAIESSNQASILVHDVSKDCALVFSTPRGKYHPGLGVELGEYWLILRIGKLIHYLDWERGKLKHCLLPDRDPAARRLPSARPARKGRRLQIPGCDPKRFGAAVESRLRAAVDVFGQVALFERQGLACMFYAFRQQLVAWMPDGTRWGPPSLSGCVETPGATDLIGQALCAACAKAKVN